MKPIELNDDKKKSFTKEERNIILNLKKIITEGGGFDLSPYFTKLDKKIDILTTKKTKGYSTQDQFIQILKFLDYIEHNFYEFLTKGTIDKFKRLKHNAKQCIKPYRYISTFTKSNESWINLNKELKAEILKTYGPNKVTAGFTHGIIIYGIINDNLYKELAEFLYDSQTKLFRKWWTWSLEDTSPINIQQIIDNSIPQSEIESKLNTTEEGTKILQILGKKLITELAN